MNRQKIKSDLSQKSLKALRKQSSKQNGSGLNKNKKRQRSSFLTNSHIKNHIKETEEEDYFTCDLCPDSYFSFKYIRKHLCSLSHQNAAKDDHDFVDLLSQIKDKQQR